MNRKLKTLTAVLAASGMGLAAMQAQGYVRFRVDGAVVEADALPKLKKTEKHDIDVVIDRIKVRPDLQQRLAESFEAALRLADGRAMADRLHLVDGVQDAVDVLTGA